MMEVTRRESLTAACAAGWPAASTAAAIRGAVAHREQLREAGIARHQIVPPADWNAPPRDYSEQFGAIVQALTATPVAQGPKPTKPIRVIHTFDPCLACAVHMIQPGSQSGRAEVLPQPAAA